MTTKATGVSEEKEEDMANYAIVLKAAVKELSAIRKANKVTDAEIRRLQASTRRKLSRIQENLRHVQAVR